MKKEGKTMTDIYYDDHMVGIFSIVANHCYARGFDKQWVNHFWSGLRAQEALYQEFLHYLDTGEVSGNYTLHGFSVLDTFVYRMEQDSYTRDMGRNADTSDKERLILLAFLSMIDLYENPEQTLLLLKEDRRNDRLN